jgi:hypothetical protein
MKGHAGDRAGLTVKPSRIAAPLAASALAEDKEVA